MLGFSIVMKIVYLGSGVFGLECLNALAQSKYNLQLIVTQPARRAARGRKPRPTPVALWAKEYSLPSIETQDVNAPDMINKIASVDPDLIVVIAFGQKIANQLINLPPKGAINVHASLLPKYRGAAPINWAILKGEKKTGISIITVAEKMDAGYVLAQTETEIAENETAGCLHERLSRLAAPLLLETLEKLEKGQTIYSPQDDSKATPAPKLKKSDGFLDFSQPADLIKTKIMGFCPWPGASAMFVSKETGKQTRITIAAAELVKTSYASKYKPGTFDAQLNVLCGQNAIKIIKVKPAGSPLMNFKDFVNGWRIKAGDMLVKINK